MEVGIDKKYWNTRFCQHYLYGLKMKPNVYWQDYFSPILPIKNERLPCPLKFCEVLNRRRTPNTTVTLIEQLYNTNA